MAVELGADALGFIFADSPRRIDREKARKIISKLPPFITAVGVFVNERRELVEEIANECGLDALQFHGEETPDYCSQFRKKVIKAFKIRTKDDLERLRYYDVSAYLLDSSVRGTSFNWDLLIGFRSEKPIILAGGLNPDNISSALSKFLPYGIDVSSGVEEYPGKKDREKLKKFMEVIKKWR